MFSLREYGTKCSTNVSVIEPFVRKKNIGITVVYYEYTKSGGLTLLVKFRAT